MFGCLVWRPLACPEEWVDAELKLVLNTADDSTGKNTEATVYAGKTMCRVNNADSMQDRQDNSTSMIVGQMRRYSENSINPEMLSTTTSSTIANSPLTLNSHEWQHA